MRIFEMLAKKEARNLDDVFFYLTASGSESARKVFIRLSRNIFDEKLDRDLTITKDEVIDFLKKYPTIKSLVKERRIIIKLRDGFGGKGYFTPEVTIERNYQALSDFFSDVYTDEAIRKAGYFIHELN